MQRQVLSAGPEATQRKSTSTETKSSEKDGRVHATAREPAEEAAGVRSCPKYGLCRIFIQRPPRQIVICENAQCVPQKVGASEQKTSTVREEETAAFARKK